MFCSTSVSRILFPAKRGTVIYLGPRLLSGSSGIVPTWRRDHSLAPDKCLPHQYVAILTRALLMHDFTLTPRQARGGIFSVALSVPRKFLPQSVAVSHCLYPAIRRMVFGLSSRQQLRSCGRATAQCKTECIINYNFKKIKYLPQSRRASGRGVIYKLNGCSVNIKWAIT